LISSTKPGQLNEPRDGEILEFPDSTQYAVSNRWEKGNIEKFINQSKKIGYEIEEQFNKALLWKLIRGCI